MRAFVIYVPIEESEKAAARCIKSAAKFGLRVEQFRGFTPQDYPVQLAKEMGIPTENFKEKYSRFETASLHSYRTVNSGTGVSKTTKRY